MVATTTTQQQQKAQNKSKAKVDKKKTSESQGIHRAANKKSILQAVAFEREREREGGSEREEYNIYK